MSPTINIAALGQPAATLLQRFQAARGSLARLSRTWPSVEHNMRAYGKRLMDAAGCLNPARTPEQLRNPRLYFRGGPNCAVMANFMDRFDAAVLAGDDAALEAAAVDMQRVFTGVLSSALFTSVSLRNANIPEPLTEENREALIQEAWRRRPP